MSGKVDLDRWGPHLRAARRTGKTLTEYAREQGLSRVLGELLFQADIGS